MKTEHKAAIYSAIVFPGSGYFFTNQKIRGYLCLATCVVILFILMREAWFKAQIISKKIVFGEIPFDLNHIREQILTTPSIYSDSMISLVYGVLFLVWASSLIDSYLIAKKENS